MRRIDTIRWIGTEKNGTCREIPARVCREEGKITVTMPRETIAGKGLETIRLEAEMLTHLAGEEGYYFFPTLCCWGVALCRFRERADGEFVSGVANMSVCGVGGCDGAAMVLVTGNAADCRFRVNVTKQTYCLQPEFQLDGDDAEEDLCVEIYPMPGATYADIARKYRAYQMEVKGCRPLRERVKDNPSLQYACESMEFRVRMGWKPVPTPVAHQTPENEPPMFVACDLERLRRLLREMKAQGIDKAQVCLVGWSAGGHDGRFPQITPCDERYGGDAVLMDVIREAKEMGFQMVAHTCLTVAYEIANNWDENALVHHKGADGKLHPTLRQEYVRSGGLSGGYPYNLCARMALEQYAKTDFPKIREYGFSGLHFVDELTSTSPKKCYHPEHPTTRKQALEAWRGIAKLSKEIFGGFQSEAGLDPLIADVDSVMYTTFHNDLTNEHPMIDEGIPFWQLVYHGIVLSNPTSKTVNYPLKSAKDRLRFIEYGGRPLMYLYSKFGSKKNWMGDIDLRYGDDPQEQAACLAALRAAKEEFEPLQHLQYEFMENHEKIAEGVYRVTYSDGTKITVDYNAEKYTVEKA